MPVVSLDHVNVRTPEPGRTLAFFRDVLRMTVTPGPGAVSVDRGGWILDDSGAAILHVAHVDASYPTDARRPFRQARGGGAIHHVALGCTDYDGTKRRLDELSIPYDENRVPQIGLRQIFVADPNDILLELNFMPA